MTNTQTETQPLTLDELRSEVSGIADTLISAGTERVESESAAWEDLATFLLANADAELLEKAVRHEKARLISKEFDFDINDDCTKGEDAAVETLADINELLERLSQKSEVLV